MRGLLSPVFPWGHPTVAFLFLFVVAFTPPGILLRGFLFCSCHASSGFNLLDPSNRS